MSILFVHGAGGFADDGPMAEALRTQLGTEVVMPQFSDDDMSYAGWRDALAGHLEALGPAPVVVAHSFGGSIAVRHLAESRQPIAGLVLLAIPDWGPDGWGIADYDLPADATLRSDLPVRLHHCRDDEVVPFDHLDRHVRRLPQARSYAYTTGGHQFDGVMDRVAATMTS
jgi:predicted alpha/beta hydrolase family esterase